MAAPTYQAKGTFGESQTDSVLFTYMTTAANDLLFLLVADIGDNQTYNVDSTWTEIESRQNIGPQGLTAYLYYKIATGSESGSEYVTRTSGGTRFAAQVYSYRGNSYLTLEDSSNNAGYSSTITWSTLSVAGTERTKAAFVVNSLGPNPGGMGGYTNIVNDVLVDGTYMELSTRENSSSGSGGTGTNGSTDGWISFHAVMYNATPPATSPRTYIVN